MWSMKGWFPETVECWLTDTEVLETGDGIKGHHIPQRDNRAQTLHADHS